MYTQRILPIFYNNFIWSIIYKNIKSLCCTPEINIRLLVNYTSIKKITLVHLEKNNSRKIRVHNGSFLETFVISLILSLSMHSPEILLDSQKNKWHSSIFGQLHLGWSSFTLPRMFWFTPVVSVASLFIVPFHSQKYKIFLSLKITLSFSYFGSREREMKREKETHS